jgi:hypothetical protein
MPHGLLKPNGILISTPLDGGRVITCDTVMCVHCNRHWVWQPGSGRKRGRCLRCNGWTCGRPACDPCVPHEQRLDNAEQGQPADHRRILVASGYERLGPRPEPRKAA